MALAIQNLKLIIGKNETDIGMRKDGDNDFGTIVPNYWGDSMTLVSGAYSDGTDFILLTDGQVDAEATIKLTSASGATISPAWDAASSSYKITVGAFAALLESHYDGVLDLVVGDLVAAPAVVAPGKPGTPTFSAITATGGKVNWTASTTGDAVDNYEVAVDKAGAPITGSPFTMAGSTLSKTLTGLTAATAYNVTIKAINAGGNATSTAATLTTTA